MAALRGGRGHADKARWQEAEWEKMTGYGLLQMAGEGLAGKQK
jgi:hypothetical protein